MWLCGTVCSLMWKLLVERLAPSEAVLCCVRGGACLGGAVPLTGLELGTAVTSANVVIGVWPARRQSRILLMWMSWVVVWLSCCESSSMWCLSLADCSPCWPRLVDSTAREQSDECHWLLFELFCLEALDIVLPVLVLDCLLQGTHLEAIGPAEGEPPLLPCHRLGWPWDSSAHSSAIARAQFMPYRRGWPLQGLPHFEHPGTCVCVWCKWHGFHVWRLRGLCRLLDCKLPGKLYRWP